MLRSYYHLSDQRVPIVFGPGRHPTSGARFLYFEGPDGMVFADSDDLARVYRFDLAQDSEMISPTIPI
ncbi:VOC family protein [Bradyrhizobium sp. Ash2021]|uniref:VOC family protein n=1 Tax=Bradyrhizobium sp. Ash2021 TaxID=2954771 RepID=UPI00281640B1|nr:VOC family protein [Bradyrhizobium sp. Ash2021]WMT72642.1 VOC family protein [Bradyrhizobium sp. Ash2021]